ncbi:MAG: hypothetical protein ABSG16_04200 [Candidatus Acidiferrum sp.]|jgi:hypothetical protein
MICPKCHAEYREGFIVCTDCSVKLVRQVPRPPVPAAPPSTFQDSRDDESVGEAPADEDPFCAFWQGEDSRVHAELCAVLEEAGIPVKTVRREDHLFRLSATSALKIGVPFSLYEKAEAAVQQAFGGSEELAETERLLEAPEETRDDPRAWGPGAHDPEGDQRARAHFDPRHFSPEEATAEVWSGTDSHLAEFLRSSIATNEIHCRSDKDGTRHRLLVLPGEACRAREIVREVVEASPPDE